MTIYFNVQLPCSIDFYIVHLVFFDLDYCKLLNFTRIKLNTEIEKIDLTYN